MDRSEEYRGYRYWLVETKPSGMKIYRIQCPHRHKTPPLERASEADIKAEIDTLIRNAAGG